MVIITRSKVPLTITAITEKALSKNIKVKNIPPIPPPNNLENSTDEDDEDEDEDEEDEDDDLLEDEFDIDPELMEDPEYRPKIDKIVNFILKRTPSLCDILETPMRLKNKAKIFELYLIFEQTEPMSEERMCLRMQLFRLFETFKKDFQQYNKNKELVRILEKDAKNYSEYNLIQEAILTLPTSESNKLVLYRKFVEMKESVEPDAKLKIWLNAALKLPFDNLKIFSRETKAMTEKLIKARSYFDQQLYGMDKVKEQLILFLHSKMLNPNSKGCCLGLVGPPGVGKTSIAKCLALAMDLPFEQISFGGAHSSEFIKGHDFTYVGSQPGEIVRCLSRMKYKNGILFFDEYEKVAENKDIISSLLHVTDFSQNHEFRDNYFSEIPIDLSSLWFIYSMNEIPKDKALADRIFTIEIEGYTEKDKVQIVQKFLIPKFIKNLEMKSDSILIDDETTTYLIRKIPQIEKGIRDLERLVKDLLTKLSFLVHNQDTIKTSFSLPYNVAYPITITPSMIDILSKDLLSSSKQSWQSMYM